MQKVKVYILSKSYNINVNFTDQKMKQMDHQLFICKITLISNNQWTYKCRLKKENPHINGSLEQFTSSKVLIIMIICSSLIRRAHQWFFRFRTGSFSNKCTRGKQQTTDTSMKRNVMAPHKEQNDFRTKTFFIKGHHQNLLNQWLISSSGFLVWFDGPQEMKSSEGRYKLRPAS